MNHSAFLLRLKGLAPLSEAEIALVERLDVREVRVRRREQVLAQQMRPTFAYTLLSGWAARYEVRGDGSRRITGFLLPGDFCGIHAICDAAMDHAIIAITDCVVGHIAGEAMAELAHRSKAINEAIWRAKLVEEAILRKWLVYIAEARQSVGRLLCELHARAMFAGLSDEASCQIPLTQEEIADALGLTPVHVNRTLQRLRAEGLVEFRGQVLRILDEAALRQVAEFDPSYLHPWQR